MNEKSPISDFAEWDVESLRLSIFHPARPTVPGLWEKLMGVSPESIDERPRQQLLREVGRANGNRLLSIIQTQRVDWNFRPDPPTDSEIVTPPTLADVNQAIPVLQRALGVSLQVAQLVERLAFGVVLVQQIASSDEGMRQLSKYLPHMELETRGGSDFVYQINRRRRSSNAPHVQINRLAKWSLEEFHSGALRVTSNQAPQFESSGPRFVNRLVLDINTAPDNSAISAQKMSTLFVEFMVLAREIATNGDVP